jgi:hypothetical protein
MSDDCGTICSDAGSMMPFIKDDPDSKYLI